MEKRRHLLSNEQYRDLLVIQELYRQQKVMFETESMNIDDLIVNINQPHVRPIVRGKVNARTEFGAKFSVSVVDEYAFLDHCIVNNEQKGEINIDKEKTEGCNNWWRF